MTGNRSPRKISSLVEPMRSSKSPVARTATIVSSPGAAARLTKIDGARIARDCGRDVGDDTIEI